MQKQLADISIDTMYHCGLLEQDSEGKIPKRVDIAE